MKKKLCSMLMVAFAMLSCQKNEEGKKSAAAEPVAPGNERTAALATIDGTVTQQYIRGFGGASIRAWIPDLTDAQRTKAFSPADGIGLSVLRVKIPNTTSAFAAEKPTIDAAKSFGATVIATAWSAPASMKDNNSTTGGKLKPSSYGEYAAFLSSYNTAVGGVAAISPANEPNITVSYESMSMTAPEVASFVAAQGDHCGAPIMAPEPYNMSQTFINSYLSNTAAAAKTSFVCGHLYGATPATYNPGKEIWMTEHFTDTEDANGWSGAMEVAKEIHDCMNAGYSMYVWWYIRRSYGLLDESGNITKRGFVTAHWSKWVRPGFNKVSCTANTAAGVYMTAYKNGNKLVIAIINRNSMTTYQNFSMIGVTVNGFNRYVTSSTSDMAQNSFTISGNSFGVNLQPSSVTTLVSW